MALFSTQEATANFTKTVSIPAEPFRAGREFKSYEYYQLYLGDNAIPLAEWEGQDLYWLRRDRELSNHRWHRAAHLITSAQPSLENYLKPFAQINSYYKTIHFWIKGKNHESRWVNGAFYLVNDLTDAYYKGVTFLADWFTPTPAYNLLQALNLAIANYAITKFYELLYGVYAEVPQKGVDAYIFDRNFIEIEQGQVALGAYSTAEPEGREVVSKLFNDTGWRAILKDMDVTGIFIPAFPELFDDGGSDLTLPPNYGKDARIQIPIAMLYCDFNFYNDPAFSTTKLAKALKNGETIYKKVGLPPSAIIPVYTNDVDVYFAFLRAHINILNVFNK
ncbi:hypothetical protein KXD93_22485 [Mucilaginibacter sp. BJC16-A38]|uniref:hypothetical protein n=1 Tax=Mucilaginibacter phenanthrenivorans TaxID=1234842 RepID=UPI0021578B8C|nr:hypothetical protein [Mucilaginibacter phenanthrenivorans]MCR8560439.1 hypothetical protein [Mucilaginibacter phenanthrenivorans]